MFDFFQSINEILFVTDLAVHYLLLVGIVWSVAFPNKRIWPPPEKGSWQHTMVWILFYLAFGLNGVLIFLDWNSWLFTSNIRIFLGIPIAMIGLLLFSWGIFTLGTNNTSGVKAGFISTGPYRFTRNPQYLGDMLLFIGIILISNSLYLLITNMLLILVFAMTPLAEEVWLENMYGDEYKNYKNNTSRFL
jgi:protein-S-isoprenylcysteine O-methyltransferase Ste14